MPLESLSAADVYARLGKNQNRIYPKTNRGEERLSPYAQPAAEAAFHLDKDAKVFATGSCFARNVEKSLKFINFGVISSPWTLPIAREGEEQSPLYNKYTIHSILNEFRWAFSDEPVDPEKCLVANKKGVYYDLNVSSAKDITGTLEDMTAFRKAYNATFAEARNADVIIITLGLVECWYDTVNQTYLNVMPPKELTTLYPDRFEFHLLDYNDIYNALCELYALLHKASKSPPNIIVTVSPVGLASTFRTDDVLVANCYSKSVQRAAVEAFVMNHDAAYFPSYEYVTLSDRKFAWSNKDFRHVRQETVDRIMADVLSMYIGESPQQQLLYTRGHATGLFDADDGEGAIALIEKYYVDNPIDDELQWIYVRALRKAKRNEEAVDVCLQMIKDDTIYYRSVGRTALSTMKMIGLTDQMHDLALWYQEKIPDDAEFAEQFKKSA